MPQTGITAKYPASLVALIDVGGPHDNFAKLILSGLHSSGATTIVCTTTIPAGWPQDGFISIDNEIIHYISFAAATFTVTGGRGAQNTTAASHADQSIVVRTLTEQHINQIMAEVVAMETALGLGRVLNQALGDQAGAALTINLALGETAKFRATGNVAITLTNPVIGHDVVIETEQDGTGSRLITWTTTVKWQGGITPAATTTINKKDLWVLHWDGTDWLGTMTPNF